MSGMDLFPSGHGAETNKSSVQIILGGLDMKQESQNTQHALQGSESALSVFPRILLQHSSCLFSNGFLDFPALQMSNFSFFFFCFFFLLLILFFFSRCKGFFSLSKLLLKFIANSFVLLLGFFCFFFISQLVLLFNCSCKSASLQIRAGKTICHKSVPG